MMELLHIHFSFLWGTGRSNKKGQSPLVLRVIYRQERRDIYTGLYCKTEDWDTTNSKVFSHCKQAATINKNLQQINYKSMQVFDELKFSGVPFTIDELTVWEKKIHSRMKNEMSHENYKKCQQVDGGH